MARLALLALLLALLLWVILACWIAIVELREVARYRAWLRTFHHEIDEMQDRIRKEVL